MKTTKLLSLFLLLLMIVSCGDDDDDDNNDMDPNDDPESGETVADQFLVAHNALRTEVGVADIEWSADLAASAQAWADELSTDCQLVHSTSGFGENIWAGTSGFFSIQQVVDSWGAEKQFYDVDNNECVGGECLHYTQIVWENSTKVGCGTTTCDGVDIWVCQYDPPGNIVGQRPF